MQVSPPPSARSAVSSSSGRTTSPPSTARVPLSFVDALDSPADSGTTRFREMADAPPAGAGMQDVETGSAVELREFPPSVEGVDPSSDSDGDVEGLPTGSRFVKQGLFGFDEDDDGKGDPPSDGEETIEMEEDEDNGMPIQPNQALGYEFAFYFGFLCVFTLTTVFTRGDSSTFYTVDSMKKATISRDFAASHIVGERTFYDVAEHADIYPFILDVCIPAILADRADHFINGQNRLMAGIRLRQKRVTPNSCDALFGVPCAADFDSDFESVQDYGPGNVWRWTNDDENRESAWWGKHHMYGGGGYVVDLPANSSIATANVTFLRDNQFIDLQTRLLLLDFQTYNPVTNLFFVGRLAFEMAGHGGVRPKGDFMAFQVDKYDGPDGTALFVLEIILLLFILAQTVEEATELYASGYQEYKSDIWNWVDCLNLFIFYATIGLRVHTYLVAQDINNGYNPDVYVSLQELVLLYSIESYLGALNAFLLWMKVFKFFRFSKRILFLYRTFREAAVDLVFFTILFVILFIGFSHSAFMAFSMDVDDFRSIWVSFLSLFRAIIGEMDYAAMADSNRFVGPLFFVLYQIVILLILVNVFLAIVTDAYSTVQDGIREDEDEHAAEAELEQFNVFGGILKRINKLVPFGGNDGEAGSNNKGSIFGKLLPFGSSGGHESPRSPRPASSHPSAASTPANKEGNTATVGPMSTAEKVESVFSLDDSAANEDDAAHSTAMCAAQIEAADHTPRASTRMLREITKVVNTRRSIMAGRTPGTSPALPPLQAPAVRAAAPSQPLDGDDESGPLMRRLNSRVSDVHEDRKGMSRQILHRMLVENTGASEMVAAREAENLMDAYDANDDEVLSGIEMAKLKEDLTIATMREAVQSALNMNKKNLRGSSHARNFELLTTKTIIKAVVEVQLQQVMIKSSVHQLNLTLEAVADELRLLRQRL